MTATRILLIGEAPARDHTKSRLEFALCAAACGLSPTLQSAAVMIRTQPKLHTFWRRTDAVNLLPAWPGVGLNGRGSLFPARDAREAAANRPLALVDRWHGVPHAPGYKYPIVLLCGTRVAAAYGFHGVKFYQPIYSDAPTVCCVPHPSRASSYWSDGAAREACVKFLVALVDDLSLPAVGP